MPSPSVALPFRLIRDPKAIAELANSPSWAALWLARTAPEQMTHTDRDERESDEGRPD